MTATMASKKKPAAKDAKVPVSFRMSAALLDALDAYRDRLEFVPDRSAVFERALREFLKAKGVKLPDADDE